MAIWEFDGKAVRPLAATTFSAEGVRERADLQKVLRENVGAIAPDTLVIAEEFGDWADSRRRSPCHPRSCRLSVPRTGPARNR